MEKRQEDPRREDPKVEESKENGSFTGYETRMIVTYDCKTGHFEYPKALAEAFSAVFDERPLWEIFEESGIAAHETAAAVHEHAQRIAAAKEPQAYFLKCRIRSWGRWSWFCIGFLNAVPGERIQIMLVDIDHEVQKGESLKKLIEYDDLTGLLQKDGFFRKVEERLHADCEGVLAGNYAIVYFDVYRFKAVNDILGRKEGDRLLKSIADRIRLDLGPGDLVGRMGSDRFAACICAEKKQLDELMKHLLSDITEYDLSFRILCNAGIYVIQDPDMSVDAMVDRASLAQASINGSYAVGFCYYSEELRSRMLSEQEIVGSMAEALEEQRFVVYYQPQYDLATGTLMGAEALVRWDHSERGLISPGMFIPIFEKNGFITKLDLHVFEQACSFLRSCMEQKVRMVPVSVNLSLHDMFTPDFVEQLEEIRKQYEIPVNCLHLELTETAMVKDSSYINEMIKKLHQYGYVVEMDDFGSGYSSLNVLKDIDLDRIKMDMLFLSDHSEKTKGDTILSSVVRMAKWLNLPVLAEGVETVRQADFLRSIGCDFVQGYLYSPPIPEEEYRKLLGDS